MASGVVLLLEPEAITGVSAPALVDFETP
jgi:hypothetical protein